MKYACYLVLYLSLFFSLNSFADNNHNAAIASAHPLATQAGFEVLNQGGNAFDAAIAVSAALAVVEPAGSGLGGGGFWLLHREADNVDIMIDGRETAPSQAHRDMYLDEQGVFDKTRSLNGPLSAGIPGVPAALDHLSQHYGVLPLSTSLAPAIRYAQQGFVIDQHYQKLAQFRLPTLQKSADANAIFLKNGQVPKTGDTIIQTDLANTLAHLAQFGHAGFYQGEVAQKLVSSVQQHGGIWTLDDLRNYKVKQRQPITSSYGDYTITSAALPSSGGIVLMQILNQLQLLPFQQTDSLKKKHLITEAMRRAYYDRSRFMGDSDFVPVPTTQLLAQDYAQQLAQTIDINHASNDADFNQISIDAKGEDTTHFSIIDQYGNRVAATLSINYPFGSGFVAAGTGVLLNDEMDDFSAQIGQANVYGLIGNNANAIAANKRPLSSMTPTFVENAQHLMIIGTPGGSRIISMVLLGILDFIDGKDAQHIVSLPRFHHQYSPNQIQFESSGFSDDELAHLQQMGHTIKRLNRQYGNMQIVIKDKIKQQLSAASDPRGGGLAEVRTISLSQ